MGRRIVEVMPSALAGVLFPHEERPAWRTSDVPEDAHIVDALWSSRQTLLLKVESAEWEDVPEGSELPLIIPSVTIHWP